MQELFDRIVKITDKLPIPLSSDKKAHLVCGFLIALIATITFYDPTVGLIIGGVFAFGKELRDEIIYGGFDTVDLLITIIGAFIGSILGFAILIAYAMRGVS